MFNPSIIIIIDNYLLFHPVVDPLLLQCETGGSTTQVTIDCQVNRPLSGTFCSFDGGHQHKCEPEVCESCYIVDPQKRQSTCSVRQNLLSPQNIMLLSLYCCYGYR